MTERSSQYATFTVERTIAFPPARVFHAFADLAAKQRWFGDPGGPPAAHSMDFRVGGREHLGGDSPQAGGDFTFDAEYRDIVPDERIVYTYDMTIDGRRISVSVATIELRPAGDGTHLRLTEQGVFLDGLDSSAARERGTSELMDALASSLATTSDEAIPAVTR